MTGVPKAMTFGKRAAGGERASVWIARGPNGGPPGMSLIHARWLFVCVSAFPFEFFAYAWSFATTRSTS